MEPNVRIVITLQKYDSDWKSYVDLDGEYAAENRDKLNLVVSPSLTDHVSVASSITTGEVSYMVVYRLLKNVNSYLLS